MGLVGVGMGVGAVCVAVVGMVEGGVVGVEEACPSICSVSAGDGAGTGASSGSASCPCPCPCPCSCCCCCSGDCDSCCFSRLANSFSLILLPNTCPNSSCTSSRWVYISVS